MSTARHNRMKAAKRDMRRAAAFEQRPSGFRPRRNRLPEVMAETHPIVHLMSYEIVTEPMPDPRERAMTPLDHDRFTDISEAILGGGMEPEYTVELEAMYDRYPNCARIANFLSIAYRFSDRETDFRRIVIDAFRRFPAYVFGLLNFLQICMEDGHLDEVEAMLGNRLDISLMYPDRKRFHISEVTCFSAVIVEFLIRQKRLQAAQSHLGVLQKINPDHPMTTHVAELFEYASAFKKLAPMAGIPFTGHWR